MQWYSFTFSFFFEKKRLNYTHIKESWQIVLLRIAVMPFISWLKSCNHKISAEKHIRKEAAVLIHVLLLKQEMLCTC
jgi:hypothetical protein